MTIYVDCEQVCMSAMATADGEEAPISQDQIDEHMLECAACREEIERMIARPPLPPCIEWAESTEHVWPRLKLRLHEEVVDLAREDEPTSGVRRLVIGAIRRKIALLCAAGCILVTIAVCSWMVRSEQSGAGRHPSDTNEVFPFVLNIDESAIGGDENSIDVSRGSQHVPFGDEAHADDIALAVVGESDDLDGKKFMRMGLLAVYKGRLPTGRFDVDDQPVFHVACSLPERLLGLRSQRFIPGTRVALYLDHDPAHGWTATSIRDLAGVEQSWREAVRRFCAVQMASEAADPAARYRELLAVDQPVLLDVAAYHALMFNPNTHALPIVRKHWQQSITLPPAGQVKPDGGGIGVGGVIVVDGVVRSATVGAASPLPLAQILSRMHDTESIDSVLRFALKRERGQQADYLELLPGLCQIADAATLRKVRGELKKAMVSETFQHKFDPNVASEHDRIKVADDKLQRLLAKQAPEN